MPKPILILGLNKRNADDILVGRWGFKKHGEPYSYSRWIIKDGKKIKRVHIQLGPYGFTCHFDYH